MNTHENPKDDRQSQILTFVPLYRGIWIQSFISIEFPRIFSKYRIMKVLLFRSESEFLYSFPKLNLDMKPYFPGFSTEIEDVTKSLLISQEYLQKHQV
jgi:hypothetical protein